MKEILQAAGYVLFLLSLCCVASLAFYLVGKIRFGKQLKRRIADHPVAHRPFQFDNRTSKQIALDQLLEKEIEDPLR